MQAKFMMAMSTAAAMSDWTSEMNIESLRPGSAAAFASFAGGAGRFSIAGIETCLKVGGHGRTLLNVGESHRRVRTGCPFARRPDPRHQERHQARHADRLHRHPGRYRRQRRR
ncbi:hypothetical protein [Ensifer soli]|uniref:hypothetical protein n=1 Tax=Ciceribacter sp. sgz301302 TaxID=3342379 RepID=UPI0035B817E7